MNSYSDQPVPRAATDSSGAAWAVGDPARVELESVYRQQYGVILAGLIRVTGDFDRGEEALQEAFAEALVSWPSQGLPDNPAAWITTTARHRAIDALRRDRKWNHLDTDVAAMIADPQRQSETYSRLFDCSVRDDSLRLIFTCCHPALNREAQVALTLRSLGGLTTTEIARAFLTPPATMAQRVVRAKRKVKAAVIPYRVPPDHLLPDRLPSVYAVVYLIFNEGYSATSGPGMIRGDLCAEAIRLGRLLVELMPDEPEALGLLALMLFHHARREARVSPTGTPVLLEDQDRSAWRHDEIAEAGRWLERSQRLQRPGMYQIQAAIAAEHCSSASAAQTDWRRIVSWYDRLLEIHPNRVVALNRAVAVAMAEGPAVALPLVDDLNADGMLSQYLFYHSTRGELLRRIGDFDQALSAFQSALAVAGNEAEKKHLTDRISQLQDR